MEIYILRDGQQYGPYSLEDVQRHLTEGSLLSSDLAWHEGMDGWLPLPEIIAPKKAQPPPPPTQSAKRRSSTGLYVGLGFGVILIAFVAGFFFVHGRGTNSTASPTSPSKPIYYGLYNCTEADPDAARLVMKLDSTGFSFIALDHPSDDPNSGKAIPQDTTITYLHSDDSAVQMDGTIRQKLTSTWTTTGTAPKPSDTTTSTTESEFSLQWYAGEAGKPDKVVLTMIDGRLQSLHFQRRD